MSDVLQDLEVRVTEKLAAALPKWDLPPDPMDDWTPPTDLPPLPEGWPQFPRERWVVYPKRRMWCLLLADKAIDHGNLAEAGFLIQYGGKDRIS